MIDRSAMTMKLLREKYKTWEGAHKSCRLENAVAEGEFRRGYKARWYRYAVKEVDGFWRVARFTPSRSEEVAR